MKKLSLLTILITFSFLLLAACGPSAPASTPTPAEPQGDAAAGKTAYLSTCIACHGPEAKGVTGLGKDLTTSSFISSKTNTELIDFVKTGRPASDPLNTTGVDMPPKGGNPALSEADILNIVAFLRSIHQQ